MPSPFPGMDPYLEAADLWPDLHQRLAFALSEQLTPRLRPRYVALVYHHIEVDRVTPDEGGGTSEARTVLGDVSVVEAAEQGRPTSLSEVAPAPVQLTLPTPREVRHFRVEVRADRGKRLVTVIEILSRANKVTGKDRDAFAAKRDGYLESDVHYLELDLLRTGARWRVGPGEPDAHYRLLLSRAAATRRAEIWPLSVRDALPTIPLPLSGTDPDVPLELGAAFERVYAGAGYDALVDYAADPPPPPFVPGDAAWLRDRVRAAPRSS